MTRTLKIEGLQELNQRLTRLPDKLRKRHLRRAVEAGAEVIRAEAEILAPEYQGKIGRRQSPQGSLKRSIYKRRMTKLCTSVLEAWEVNVKRRGRGSAPYAAIVEYGTVKMDANPYMRPAFDAKKEAAAKAMGTYLAFALPDLVRR